MSNQQPNRLIDEKSPYLLQHAYNPVNWFPWGEEAFQKANQEEKPVFLSIGYSTCHWCHVMEEESFEDEAVASLLNNHFVPIKVDREERPDIDNVYMKVCQALTGQGGWPLTIIMTPNKEPFFAGTYFPRTATQGRPGLIQILEQVKTAWQNNRDELVTNSQKIINQVQRTQEFTQTEEVNTDHLEKLLKETVASLQHNFDQEYGGFGTSPKFPRPHNLMFLLRYSKLMGDQQPLEMVTETLDNLYRGGIYDQIGGGFARYSTDQKWLVPHFEKMLYDNALLTIVYLEAYQATNDQNYAVVAEETLEYLMREMQSPTGGFYSAEDADTEQGEGAFYLWSKKKVEELLGVQQGKEFCSNFDITAAGNFVDYNIPNLIGSSLSKVEVKNKYTRELEILFTAREQRARPFKDDKILTGWNGLAIAAFSIAARILNADKYQAVAKKTVEFITAKLKEPDRLLARYRKGEAAYLAYAEDYAFLIWGLIELYETSFQPKYLQLAVELNQELIDYFWDDAEGGLYQSGVDSEELIFQPKEVYDGALPAGNSVATLNFLRLADLTGQEEWRKKAEKQIEYFYSQIRQAPTGHLHFLMAVIRKLINNQQLVIATNNEKQLTEINNILATEFTPFIEPIVITPEVKSELSSVNTELADKVNFNDNQLNIYICENYSCQQPLTTVEEFKKKFNI